MNRVKQLRLIGLIYIAIGIGLLILASSIIFQVLMLIGGLMLINEGMIKIGKGSLWRHASHIFIRVWH